MPSACFRDIKLHDQSVAIWYLTKVNLFGKHDIFVAAEKLS